MQKTIRYNGRSYTKNPKQPYYYTSNPRDSKALHRQTWIDTYGAIPEGFHIHHKDENPFNNAIENLEAKEKVLHQKDHSKKKVRENPERFKRLAEIGREHAKAWHSSEKGIEWHRQNAINCNFGHQEYGEKNCDQCAKSFIAKAIGQRFCHTNCKSAWRRKNNPDKQNVKCEKCGEKFSTLKYLPARFCSKKCRPAPNPNGCRGKKL